MTISMRKTDIHVAVMAVEITVINLCENGKIFKTTSVLKQMGYQDVTNIGSISSYRGKVVKG